MPVDFENEEIAPGQAPMMQDQDIKNPPVSDLDAAAAGKIQSQIEESGKDWTKEFIVKVENVNASTLTPEQQQAYDDILAAMDEALAKQAESSEPPITVDGLTMSTATSTMSDNASSTSSRVSITGDSITSNAVGAFLEKLCPFGQANQRCNIISSMKLPIISVDDVKEIVRLNQVERILLKETILSGLRTALEADTDSSYTDLFEENEINKASLAAEINALGHLKTSANTAGTGLNIRAMSDQIIEVMNTSLSSLLQTSEKGHINDIGTIDDLSYQQLASVKWPLLLSKTSMTNTEILANIAICAINSFVSPAIAALDSPAFPESRIDGAKSPLFSLPAVQYKSSDGDINSVPHVNDLFEKNSHSIIARFNPTDAKEDLDRTGESHSDTKPHTRGTMFAQPSSAVGADIDDLLASIVGTICNISNELIVSAGIGRLKGGQIGNRFMLESTESSSPKIGETRSIYDVTKKLLGVSPKNQGQLGVYSLLQPTEPGSFLDYLVLGEQHVPASPGLANSRKTIIAPFESSAISTRNNNTELVVIPGQKYFIEAPLTNTPASRLANEENSGTPLIEGLSKYSLELSGFIDDFNLYTDELMAFSTETSLTPEMILARILQDFASVLTSLTNTHESRDAKSDAVAGLFSDASIRYVTGYTTKQINEDNASAWNTTGIPAEGVNGLEILCGSAVIALNEYDQKLEDTGFVLNRSKLSYSEFEIDSDGEEQPKEDSFEKRLRCSIGSLTGHRNYQGVGFNKRIQKNDLSPSAAKNLVSQSVPTIFYVNPNVTSTNYDETPVQEGFTLHDNTWNSSSNLINLMVKTIRELQKEALNLAQRDAATSNDYRNVAGETLCSSCDDDKFLTVITNLYSQIAAILLPVRTWQYGTVYTDDFAITDQCLMTQVEPYKATANLRVINAIIAATLSGTPITESLYETTSVNANTEMNTVQSTLKFYGQNNYYNTEPQAYAVCEIQNLVKACKNIRKHRFYQKAAISVTSAAAACVSSSASEITKLFNIISDNSVDFDSLSDNEKVIYNMYINNQKDISTNDAQNNLNRAAVHNITPEDDAPPVDFRKGVDPSFNDRSALNVFIDELYKNRNDISLDKTKILTLGMPNGMIQGMAAPAYVIGDSAFIDTNASLDDYLESVSKVSNNPSPLFRVKLERIDEVYKSGLTVGALSNILIDPTLFVLPDSIKFTPEDGETFEDIFKKTNFYTIIGGNIVSTTAGSDMSNSLVPAGHTALRSYLLDLLMYETAKFKWSDGLDLNTLGKNGNIKLTPAGFTALQKISSNGSLSRLVGCKKGFIDLFHATGAPRGGPDGLVPFDSPDPSIRKYRLKAGEDLINNLSSPFSSVLPKFSTTDLRIAASLGQVPMLTDQSSLIGVRPYDRIINVVYDDSTAATFLESGGVNVGKRAEYDLHSLLITLQTEQRT